MSSFESIFQKLALISIDNEKIKAFIDIIDDLYSLAEKYNGRLNEFSIPIHTIAELSYCTQAKYIHRGCYCPSPVIDLLIGNTKRGKVTKKLPKTKKEYYKYCWDINGYILSAEKFDPEISVSTPIEIEFIIRESDIEYGISFMTINNTPVELFHLSKAYYENSLIKSYSAMVYSEYLPKDVMGLHHEEYTYSGTRLTKADMYFNILPKMNIYDLSECLFKYDDNGKIYQYDVLRQSIKTTYSVSKAKYIQRTHTAISCSLPPVCDLI